MKQRIYKCWKDDLSKRFWIKERFQKKSYDEMLYSSILATMRYISKHIHFTKGDFKNELKKDLKDCRQYFLSKSII